MDKTIEQAVERAITTMHDNLGEPITVDDMARAAMFSKFHFTRMFERATGVTPARFLSAVRLQRAKALLTSTSMTVADISILVGYNSVGTFSSRFTKSVGLAPTVYRRMGGYAGRIAVCDGEEWDAQPSATVQGVISAPGFGRDSLVFVGLFPQRVPEGSPVRCMVLQRPGRYQFEDVPTGSWYLLAHSVAADSQDLTRDTFAGNRGLSVGTHGPIRITHDTAVEHVDLALQPISVMDPPVLLALLDVRTVALRIVSGLSPEGDSLPAGAGALVPGAQDLVTVSLGRAA